MITFALQIWHVWSLCMIGMSQSFITQLTCYDSLLNGQRPSPTHLKKCWRVMAISCMPKSSLSSKLLRLCDSRKLVMPRKGKIKDLTIQVKTLKYVWPFSPFFEVYASLTAPSDTIALFTNNCQVGSHATGCTYNYQSRWSAGQADSLKA